MTGDIVWSPDGTLLAFGDEELDLTKIYDVRTQQQVYGFAATTENDIYRRNCSKRAWSPDGKYLALDCDKEIVILDTKTWQVFRSLSLTQLVFSMDWSPDSQCLVTGNDNGQIDIWHIKTRQKISSLTGHTDFVRRVIWARSGKMIVSSSIDGTIRVWRITDNE